MDRSVLVQFVHLGPMNAIMLERLPEPRICQELLKTRGMPGASTARFAKGVLQRIPIK